MKTNIFKKIKLTAGMLSLILIFTACAPKTQYPDKEPDIQQESGLYFDESAAWYFYLAEDAMFYTNTDKVIMQIAGSMQEQSPMCNLKDCRHDGPGCNAYISDFSCYMARDKNKEYLYILYRDVFSDGQINFDPVIYLDRINLKDYTRENMFSISDGDPGRGIVFGDEVLYLPVYRREDGEGNFNCDITAINYDTKEYYSASVLTGKTYVRYARGNKIYATTYMQAADGYTYTGEKLTALDINTLKPQVLSETRYPPQTTWLAVISSFKDGYMYTVRPTSEDKKELVKVNLETSDETVILPSDTYAFDTYPFEMNNTLAGDWFIAGAKEEVGELEYRYYYIAVNTKTGEIREISKPDAARYMTGNEKYAIVYDYTEDDRFEFIKTEDFINDDYKVITFVSGKVGSIVSWRHFYG